MYVRIFVSCIRGVSWIGGKDQSIHRSVDGLVHSRFGWLISPLHSPPPPPQDNEEAARQQQQEQQEGQQEGQGEEAVKEDPDRAKARILWEMARRKKPVKVRNGV